MFNNGRKTIGLFLFNQNGDFQQRVIKGLTDEATKRGYNVAVFCSYGNYGIYDGYFKGELKIFELPKYDELAGIVFCNDTFNDDRAKDILLKKIEEEANCPVVAIRDRVDGFNNIVVDELKSMEGIIRHVVEEHGKKDVAFMTGHKGRLDSESRLSCFKMVMEENGHPVPEDRYFYGDFWKFKAKDAVEHFLKNGKIPEAIMCANDYMALAVIDELYERGISVPDDVIVTGYDGIREGNMYTPSLSTVDIDFNEMGRQAAIVIDRHQEDDSIEDVYVQVREVYRKSCGCVENENIKIMKERCKDHSESAVKDNLEMQISFMTIDLGETKQIDDMHNVIKAYIWNIKNLNNYYISLREDLEDSDKDLEKFTRDMSLRIGFNHYDDMGALNIPFDDNDLLPKIVCTKEPQAYIFTPIHYQENFFGYEAISFIDNMLSEYSFVRWNIAISNAIDRLLKQVKMRELIDELQNMYIQDALTGLYNRRGFELYAGNVFKFAKDTSKKICVIGIDMDDLKPVNDIFGHHEGDSALRAVAYAINEARHEGQIGARIGGDEFEVAFAYDNESDLNRWKEKFELSLEHFNQKSQKPYKVYASIGYHMGVPGEKDTLEYYMAQSDNMMYKNKVQNKIRRNKGGEVTPR